MTTGKDRRPSPLQRRVLIVLAALDRPGPVATRDIERVLERSGDVPVYGPNLRASCRRMEAAGWLRRLRAPNLQLAVELTDAGRALAAPLLAGEQARVLAEQRAATIRVLPLVPRSQADEADDRPVELDDRWHLAWRGDYVIRLDGTTCLQLWSAAGEVTRLEGDPLQVATWLQACHDAGIAVRVQINESTTPEAGTLNVTAPADQTSSWLRQLEGALQAQGISGLNEEIRMAMIMPGGALRDLPPPARLLHVLRESPEAFPLTAAGYAEDTEAALADLLARAGFTGDQAQELQWHRIRWPQMSQEDADRRELNSLLDELEQRQLYCNRGQLTAIVFSPVRNVNETWTERLKWLLGGELAGGFGFRSPLSRDAGARALTVLAGYTGREVAEHLATVIAWNVARAGERS
ncbi:UNVERIFIED_ORG: DNA-binding MarR family transcriptional regulator [Pantoea agglomerans]